MAGRIFLALLWAAPVLYAFFFAPPLEPDVWGLILTGMWIALYAAVLLPDALGEAGLRAGPFLIAAIFLGSYALLPYLIFRSGAGDSVRDADRLVRATESRAFALFTLLSSFAFSAFAPGPGSFTLAFEGWRESAFLNVMGLDFLALCIAFPFAMHADMHRRDFDEPVAFRAFALLPLIGSALYLLFRPPLVCTEISRPGPIAAAA